MATEFFDSSDSPHGLAKRIILYRFIQGELGRAVNTQRQTDKNDYHLTYFDAFSGRGRYGNPATNNQEEVQETGESEREEVQQKGEKQEEKEKTNSKCPFDDESFGSPLVALQAIFKHVSEKAIYGKKKILLVFVEKDESRFKNLKKNVFEYLDNKQDYSKYKSRDDQINVSISKDVDHQNNVSLDIKLYCCDFRDFNNADIRNNWPMVSFFDPFGFSQIPMEKLLDYVGNRKSIIINLMVESINRFKNTKKNEMNFKELFGCSENENWKDDIPDNFETLDVPSKMRLYSQIYRKNFQKKTSVKFLEFSMRRGSEKGVEKSYIYYLLYGALDLRSMAIAKYAMHVAAQNFDLEESASVTSNELFFSDFHFKSGISWRPKTSGKDEAEFIYNRWKGKNVSFGELKEWIILESPYQVHSAALRYLEKDGRLQILSTEYDRESDEVPKYERKNKSFPQTVGFNASSKDWDKEGKIRYCNGWSINFPSKETNNKKPELNMSDVENSMANVTIE